MILRCTARVLTLLGVRAAALLRVPSSDDDWYLNLIWIERKKCLLLTNDGTLFPVFAADVRKSEITPIGPYIVGLVEEHLRAEGLAVDTLGSLDQGDVRLAKTGSRSILGVMNDAACHARYRIEAMGGIDRTDMLFLNRFLRRALHKRAGAYVTPLDLVARRGQSLQLSVSPLRKSSRYASSRAISGVATGVRVRGCGACIGRTGAR